VKIGRFACVLLLGILVIGGIGTGASAPQSGMMTLAVKVMALPQVGGGGAPPPATGTQHQAALSWTSGTSVPGVTVVGTNVYRGVVAGGPYGKLNATPVTGTSYTDLAVTQGVTERYIVTAVSSTGNESAWSNEASAVIPPNPNPPAALAATGQ